MKPIYYYINEEAARRAKEANSFSDYVQGSATADYQRMVDKAAEIAAAQKQKVDAMYHEKIDNLLDYYARKLANNINQRNEIDARVPSVLIAGPANFPVRQKEKQNAARDRNSVEYAMIQEIIGKIRGTGMGGIRSDDKNAIEKLTVKLHQAESEQAKMKEVNAYYRKHGNLDGCPGLTDRERYVLMSRGGSQPYPGWNLSNNSANIRRIKKRIESLQKEAQRAAESPAAPVQGPGYTLTENTAQGRIQFVFDGKPDDDTRALLKSYGFRWAPSQGAWQRMLNDNGRYAAERICEKLAEKEG